MDQVSGSHFKLVYESLEHGNGAMASPCFIKGTLYQTFNHKYPLNIISKDNILDDEFIYLYPIEISAGTIEVLLSTNLLNSISPIVLTHLKNNKIKLIINMVHDPIIGESIEINQFEKTMNSMGVDSSNIIFIFGNRWDKEHTSNMLFCQGCQGLVYQSRELHKYPYNSFGYVSDCIRETDLNSEIRPKKFLSPNNIMKPHRVMLSYFVVKYNLLNDGIFSFIQPLSSEQIKSTLNQYSYDTGNNFNLISDQISDMLPYELDTKGILPNEKWKIVGLPGNVKDWYTNSYLHIVTETLFSGENCFLSEKVFRPIINLQPFLIFGQPRSLIKLKQLGFKTFSPFINEMYDLEVDDKKRLLMLEKEILKFATMSIQEIHEWYYSIKDILIYNQKHLASFSNCDFFDDALTKIYNHYTGK